MNILLWAIQAILAVKSVSTAFTHALRQDQGKMQEGIHRMGAGTPALLVGVSVLLLVAGVGVVLPLALGILPGLTPFAAAMLAFAFLADLPLHRRCRENPSLIPSLVLALLAAFVAYGRWAPVP